MTISTSDVTSDRCLLIYRVGTSDSSSSEDSSPTPTESYGETGSMSTADASSTRRSPEIINRLIARRKRHDLKKVLGNELRRLYRVVRTQVSPLWDLDLSRSALCCCAHCVFSDVDSVTDSHVDSIFSAGQQKDEEAEAQATALWSGCSWWRQLLGF